MTELFTLNRKNLPVGNIKPLTVETPLGHIRFNCSFNEKSLSNVRPQATFLPKHNSTLFSWAFEECNIEFLCLYFSPKLPLGMHVDNCFAGVWRIKTLNKRIFFNLSGVLESQITPNPESGEFLLAQSFEDPAIKLTIGTEDEEALVVRASEKNWLPYHFRDSLKPDNVRYDNQGLKIVLPESERHDLIQVHFIVAWTSKRFDPLSTWYAVDQSPEYILNFLNQYN